MKAIKVQLKEIMVTNRGDLIYMEIVGKETAIVVELTPDQAEELAAVLEQAKEAAGA